MKQENCEKSAPLMSHWTSLPLIGIRNRLCIDVFGSLFSLFFRLCENEAIHKQARSKKSRERKKKTRKIEHFKKFFEEKYHEVKGVHMH